MKKIKLTGTSFLLPNNKNWLQISKIYKIKFGSFGNWHDELINDKSEILSICLFLDDFINLDQTNFVSSKKKLDSFFKLLEQRVSKLNNNIVVSYCSNNNDNSVNTSKYPNLKQKINFWFFQKIYNFSNKYKNLFIIDLDKEFSKVGLSRCLDKRNWYYAHSYLTNNGIDVLANSLKKIINRIYNSPSKVLVLDCDNTIWGGVIGEDGIEGIKIGEDGEGKIYEDFQKVIKSIKSKGIILALLSKNNEQDVWDVFKNHDHMILKKKDIISWKINWNEKFNNIKEISKELDLGLDSFVFWDDNPIERDQMKKFASEVKTIDVPDDIYLWPEHLKNLDELSKLNSTKEDKNKSKQYIARAKFIRDKDNHIDKISYLKSIKLSAKKIEINSSNIARAEQINLKTNQYNLRTTRITANEIKKFNNINKMYCFLGSLNDKYGDHGIVGSVYLKKIDDDVIFLENLLMSCRVIGRYFESWLLNEVIKLSKSKYKYIIGQYTPTKRNIVVKNFFKSHNFEELINNKYKINYKKIYKLLGKKNLYITNLNKIKIKNIDIYR